MRKKNAGIKVKKLQMEKSGVLVVNFKFQLRSSTGVSTQLKTGWDGSRNIRRLLHYARLITVQTYFASPNRVTGGFRAPCLRLLLMMR